jgi:hypothetical protein
MAAELVIEASTATLVLEVSQSKHLGDRRGWPTRRVGGLGRRRDQRNAPHGLGRGVCLERGR